MLSLFAVSVSLTLKASSSRNILWNPSEAGPWANVDRGWGQPYCLFDWDNLFASYMLSLHSKDFAISNLMQIVKSRTIAGFVPGYGPLL